MDVRQLEIVQAIAATGSFTKAGQRLHVSQSAISRQVLLLEEELREPVFLRLGRRIRITPAGEAILALAQRVARDIEETRAGILEKQRTLSGSIRLAGTMTVCLYVFPELIKEYRRRHPAMDVRVTTGLTPRLLRRLHAGMEDIALLPLPVDAPDLICTPVLEEELVLVTDPHHPFARRREVRPLELVRQPFVLFEAGAITRRQIDGFFARERIEPRIVTETENVEVIKSLVRIGLGLTIIPYQAVAREVRSSQLACARIAGAPMRRQTGWVHQRLNRVPRPVQELMSALDHILDRLRITYDPRTTPLAAVPPRVRGLRPRSRP